MEYEQVVQVSYREARQYINKNEALEENLKGWRQLESLAQTYAGTQAKLLVVKYSRQPLVLKFSFAPGEEVGPMVDELAFTGDLTSSHPFFAEVCAIWELYKQSWGFGSYFRTNTQPQWSSLDLMQPQALQKSMIHVIDVLANKRIVQIKSGRSESQIYIEAPTELPLPAIIMARLALPELELIEE